ncbi:hypothetical protein, partial [Xanthomonas phaseoli]|uniref:hypothetical protein n=1 Tax=Xanthomonas phaseoli TaxID=1985254 RepID=UPI0035F2729E
MLQLVSCLDQAGVGSAGLSTSRALDRPAPKRRGIRGRHSTLSIRCIMLMKQGMSNVPWNQIRPGERQKKAPAVPGLL